MSEEKHLNLSKQTLPQLQELLERQNALLRNKKLLGRLQDKGESVKQMHDKIQKEIQHLTDVEKIQASLSALAVGASQNSEEFLNDKHVKYVCSKEKPIEDTRYRPHRTLTHEATRTSPQKSPKKFTEVTSAFEPYLVNEPTKCIPLAESLVIQNDQAIKLMEEQVKRTLRFMNDDDQKNDDSDDEPEEQGLEDEQPVEVDSIK